MSRQHDRELCNRQSLRRPDHDYFSNGVYFVTVRTLDHAQLFGAITDNGVALNDAGRMVATEWRALDDRFYEVSIDMFVVMPDHFHGILIIRQAGREVDSTVDGGAGPEDDSIVDGGAGRRQAPHPTVSQASDDVVKGDDRKLVGLGRVIQAFKSITTLQYSHGVRTLGWTAFNGKVWQRDYYDRIVRDREELQSVRSYIARNPSKPYTNDTDPSDLQ